jgi:hypothetical protein
MWDIDTGPDPDSWAETANPGLADVSGYKIAAGRSIRWGQNQIAGNIAINLGTHGDLLSFYTNFDESGLLHEAQGAGGDSGGAIFWKDGGEWQLAGIMNAVGTLNSFPYDGRPW